MCLFILLLILLVSHVFSGIMIFVMFKKTSQIAPLTLQTTIFGSKQNEGFETVYVQYIAAQVALTHLSKSVMCYV